MIGTRVLRCGVRTVAALAIATGAAAADPEALARGDAAYALRGLGQVGGRAAPGPIAEAVAAYEEALGEGAPGLEAHWKLLRALFFQGEYAADAAGRRAAFGRGVAVGRAAEGRLADSIGIATLGGERLPAEVAAALRGNPDAVPVCFWSAVVLASWGREAGAMLALREGIAERLRWQAELVIALDPTYEGGGAHRLLGRLHAEVPRIPFLTPWVHRERALAELQRALALAPDDPWNQLLLGMTLLEQAPAEKPRAFDLLRRVAARGPRPEFMVEDTGLEQTARALLAAAGGGEENSFRARELRLSSDLGRPPVQE